MLDLQTLQFASTLAAIIAALFFSVVWFLNRGIPGLNLWLVAVFMQPFGWLLITVKHHIPTWLGIFIPNVSLLLSALLFLLGWRTFLNFKDQNTKIITIFLLLVSPLTLYFLYIEPDVVMRIFITYSTAAVLMGLCVYSFLSCPRKQLTIGGVIFCATCISILCISLLRISFAVDIGAANDILSWSLTNIAKSIFGFFAPYGLTLAIFLLCNEKQTIKIKKSEQKEKNNAQLKQHYLATLAHELRTPLNGIIGKAQLIRPLLSSTKLQQDCDVIIESGQALSQLANEVLELSSSEQYKTKIFVEVPTKLNVYLEGITQLLAPLAEKKQIKLTLNTPSCVVLLDQNKIRQVLINLLNNAIKFTEQGEVNLTVNMEINKDAAVTLTFIVTDTGIGIPISEQDLLTEPFTQGANHNTDALLSQNGYGLGLSICKHLLHNIDSQLSFTSTEDQGSRFYFSISTKTTDIIVPPSDVPLPIQSLKVLLIEDIQLNQEIAKAMLEKDNHKVTIANTGYGALALMNRQVYDIIFLDMQLSDIHGLDVLKKIRQVPSLNIKTPVIALTATITAHYLKLYEQANITQVIEKPILLPILREAIYNISNKKEKIIAQPINQLLAFPLFDETPLSFLVENLPKEKFAQALIDAPDNILLYAKNSQQSVDYQTQIQWLHKLAGYSAQLGLTRLSKKSSELEEKAEQQKKPVSVELHELITQSANALSLYKDNRHSKCTMVTS